ncbi:MAG: hypothetical protein KR126chlam6_01050 [Candidatus Anoxychlamydiales bacterium]|nr:hypothetical protein [Candidatus Anoxychlamydiales bacterium]
MSEFHQIGIDEANKEEKAITFLFPDIIMSKDFRSILFNYLPRGCSLYQKYLEVR